jgi:hypothetical protein
LLILVETLNQTKVAVEKGSITKKALLLVADECQPPDRCRKKRILGGKRLGRLSPASVKIAKLIKSRPSSEHIFRA